MDQRSSNSGNPNKGGYNGAKGGNPHNSMQNADKFTPVKPAPRHDGPSNHQGKPQNPVGDSATVRCFHCNEMGHRIKNCPYKSGNKNVRGFSHHVRMDSVADGESDVKKNPVVSPSSASNETSVKVLESHHCMVAMNNKHAVYVDNESLLGPVALCVSDRSGEDVCLAESDWWFDCTATTDDFTVENSFGLCKSTNPDIMVSEVKVSPLEYFDIMVEGLQTPLKCLRDGGSQIAIVRKSLLNNVKYKSEGLVKLQGTFGSPVTAELCTLFVRSKSSSQMTNIPVTFAVTEAMVSNCDAIIPEDVAQELVEINQLSSDVIKSNTNYQVINNETLVDRDKIIYKTV